MISKFALAFKTRTIDFFAEEEEDADDAASTISDIDLASAPEEIITGQRVVVLKPDPPPPLLTPDDLITSVFVAISSFRTAYLQLQAAHSPFDSNVIISSDANAVKQLRIISDMKSDFSSGTGSKIRSHLRNPSRNSDFLEAQAKENQTLLKTFEIVLKKLQADIDRKDSEAASLKMKIKEIETENLMLGRKIRSEKWEFMDDKIERLLTIGLFDRALKDCCRAMHEFSKFIIRLMKKNSSMDVNNVANLVYPNVKYAKFGHWMYAILSYISLQMFDGFDLATFCWENTKIEFEDGASRRKSLSEFVEHLSIDHLEVMQMHMGCEFAKFCTRKYDQLFSKCGVSPIFQHMKGKDYLLRSLNPSNPLYHLFMDMASSIWLLHKLSCAYDPKVEIFQVRRGRGFSIVFMESVVKTGSCKNVEFTVFPGFRVGKTVIQCRVYLQGLE